MAGPTRVALALGSGGARGYAHIGVIEALEERGLEIAGVAGSSMGALVGGLYAAGRLDDYTRWATSLTQLDVLRLLDVSLSAPGAIHAEKILDKVREILGDTPIEGLRIPYTAVATDLAAGRSVWFQRGPVDVAIRASIAIPGVITPYVLNGRVLADGGILDPLPLAPILAAGADVTIGVSLGAEERDVDGGAPAHASAEPRPVDEWIGRFRRSAAQLLERDVVRSMVGRFGGGPGARSDAAEDVASEDAEVVDDPVPVPKLSRFEVMNRSLDLMQSALARYQLAGYPPDVLIRIPRKSGRSLDFHRAAEMIALGRSLTESALDAAGLGTAPAAEPPDPDTGTA
ncbi:esterase [Rhodococcus ruber Chol-4]|jgi:NTE family protein|uniref:Uncharacterized protein n=1 Tax=Rhodococcus ruber TaxID=1830 RepID=A0A098BJ80_9NOCA|nr:MULTISPECIES: patatin-like phospholipase family protein [Rhodococcus]MDO2377943.1 patatin-like phospholipase family protein [Rhodococcus ruber]RIK11091.1 MAG: esterase [Acidobacteriota bacterium]ATQ28916.1 esterase [Rhodococcus ruber]AUM17948.1 esterase [Rhodococcus ruber]AWH00339.1 esterase [Rhodococcus ruber]